MALDLIAIDEEAETEFKAVRYDAASTKVPCPAYLFCT